MLVPLQRVASACGFSVPLQGVAWGAAVRVVSAHAADMVLEGLALALLWDCVRCTMSCSGCALWDGNTGAWSRHAGLCSLDGCWCRCRGCEGGARFCSTRMIGYCSLKGFGIWLLVPLQGAAARRCCQSLLCRLCFGAWFLVPLQGVAACECCTVLLLLSRVSSGVCERERASERAREGGGGREGGRDTPCTFSPDGRVSALPSQAWCKEIGSGVVSVPQWR